MKTRRKSSKGIVFTEYVPTIKEDVFIKLKKKDGTEVKIKAIKISRKTDNRQ